MSRPTRHRVGVLVSGAGTNLRALLEEAARPQALFRVVLVLSNRPSAPALRVALEHGVAAEAMPVARFGGDVVARDRAMQDRLRAAWVELVVCAGYDRVLSAPLLDAFEGAMLNLHPSLLPAFGGGMNAVEEALAAGVKVSGATVHLLEPGATDAGPIVLQEAVPVLDDDDEQTLLTRIHEAEWRILPAAVTLWCEGRLQRQGRRIRVLPSRVAAAQTAELQEEPR
ncbi:MAG TPA: phosphoribosylglycinamide formyltransferase [Candidatus Dormibacteraeota bacterium]